MNSMLKADAAGNDANGMKSWRCLRCINRKKGKTAQPRTFIIDLEDDDKTTVMTNESTPSSVRQATSVLVSSTRSSSTVTGTTPFVVDSRQQSVKDEVWPEPPILPALPESPTRAAPSRAAGAASSGFSQLRSSNVMDLQSETRGLNIADPRTPHIDIPRYRNRPQRMPRLPG